MIKFTALMVCLAISMSGCATRKEPSFGETLREEGKNRTDLGKQWSKGRTMIENGGKLIKKGKKQVATGKKNISEGESLMVDGKELVRKSEEAYRNARDW